MADESTREPNSAATTPEQPESLGATITEAPTPVSRIYAYAAVAAILGMAAGLVIASHFGHAAKPVEPNNAATANSDVAGLASLVKIDTPVLADTIPAPVAAVPVDAPPPPRATPAHHARPRKKAADVPARFAIEGDDELVGYDASSGVIQTSARKVFVVSATGGANNSSKWQDGQGNVHYKCDLNQSCTLTRKGAPVVYAQLKR